jgi:hypothetical protein
MLNSTHWSSSQEFEDSSKSLRTVALTLDTMTATMISHARRFPSHVLIASIPWLNFRSDCTGSPPRFALLPSCQRWLRRAVITAKLA